MADEHDESILGTGVTTRQVEAFGRKVAATTDHLMGGAASGAYQSALTNIHRELRRPAIQRSVFSFAQASPRETIRARLSTSEIQHRALTYIPDDLLTNVPEDENTYSLFQGFQATIPEDDAARETRRKDRRKSERGRKLLEDGAGNEEEEGRGPPALRRLKKEQERANHRHEMLGIRKNMCSAEIVEIDKKISNLQMMRKIVLDRLADLEEDELKLEQEIGELDIKVEDMQALAAEEEAAEAEKGLAESTETVTDTTRDDQDSTGAGVATPRTETAEGEGFMSESIYQKIPDNSAKPRRQKLTKRKSMPIRHGHFEPGTSIREIAAHPDLITALDFDAPFGTMVSAALDDTLRVWDLNSGRCLGLLEGHRASVRCLQVEDTLVATGSIDASIRLWDLSKIEYSPFESGWTETAEGDEAEPPQSSQAKPSSKAQSSSSTAECELFSLEAHVAEITALHFHNDTLVSGSADKTLRQWDLVKGRCVQTLDVLWAAAQASSTPSGSAPATQWRTTTRLPDASADFVGAVQCFDAALACGTADGMVRLWDLRSGQVSRSLVGHTGPVTCLQFDDVHLVTGSLDRSIRIWDLRTGTIFDAFAFDSPITSMMFDARRIVSTAGEDVVKVYDKTDGRQWDCGPGAQKTNSSSASSSGNIIEKVRIRDGFMVEGRRNGTVGVWTC